MNSRVIETVKNYRIFDDNFSKEVFNDQECIEYLLSLILRETVILKRFYINHSIQNVFQRSLILDIYAIDIHGRHINVEIQGYKEGSYPTRAMFHNSTIHIKNTKPKKKWNRKYVSIIIFILKKNYLNMKYNRSIYQMRYRDEYLDDGLKVVYVNGECGDDLEMERLIRDMKCRNVEDMSESPLKERCRLMLAYK